MSEMHGHDVNGHVEEKNMFFEFQRPQSKLMNSSSFCADKDD